MNMNRTKKKHYKHPFQGYTLTFFFLINIGDNNYWEGKHEIYTLFQMKSQSCTIYTRKHINSIRFI